MARDNVGVVRCPFTGGLAVVRADCRGKLYYYSQAGKIAPNLPQGQAWLKAQMQPLTSYRVTEIARGAPLQVEPLTEVPATKEREKPLTDESEEKPPKKSAGIMDFLGGF